MSPQLYVVIGALAAMLIPSAWRQTSHLVTLVHEAGHAFVAVLTGRRLRAIKLHSDTSGLTVTKGRTRGITMIATAAAGYLAPSVFGLIIVALIAYDRTLWSLYIALVGLGFLLLWIRNWFGLLLILLAGSITWLIANKTTAHFVELTAWFLGAFFLIAAPRAVWSHVLSRDVRRQSDSDVLARISPIPAWLWALTFQALTLGALVWGILLLEPLVR